MSLWRVKHTLSPVVEKAIVAFCALLGVFAIQQWSLTPLAVETSALITSLRGPISLDTDAWTRYRNEIRGYEYAAPLGWFVSAGDPDKIVLAEYRGSLSSAAGDRVVLLEDRPLGPRQETAAAAASDFAGTRPALYDVGVDGRAGVFAILFAGDRVVRQAVYVRHGDRLLVASANALEPAAFSALISTIKFMTPANPQ